MPGDADAQLAAERAARAAAEVVADRLARLQAVATELAAARTIDEVADVVLTRGLRKPGASTGGLWLLDADARALRCVRTAGMAPQVEQRFGVLDTDGESALPLLAAVRTGEPVFATSRADRDRQWPVLADVPTNAEAFAVIPLDVEGVILGALTLGFPAPREFDDASKRFLKALADQCAVALERARLYEAERRAAGRLQFLATAGQRLSSTLDASATAECVVELAVGTLGDLAVLYLSDPTGVASIAAAAHADAGHADALAAIRDAPVRRGSRVAGALAGGNVVTYDETSEADLRRAVPDPARFEAARRLAFGPMALAPLCIREQPIGVLSVARAAGGPAYGPDDVALLEEFAARAAVAVDNARLFEQRSEVAHTLQRSLLPPVLPDVPGVALAARFRPTYEGLLVGGDFYDVFPVGEHWAVVIGDVVGTGARAASTTAVVRHTARAVAPLLRNPEQVVAAIHRAVREYDGEDAFCTLVFAELRPRDDGGVTLEMVGAGHPSPYVVRGDGTLAEMPNTGPLVGPFETASWDRALVVLSPGDTLVCYTDGVIEARAPVPLGSARDDAAFFGDDRLRAVIAATSGSADDFADAIESAVLEWTGGQPDDDVAILVVQAT